METAIDTEAEKTLDSLPTDEPVELEGETVYLNVDFSGAELGLFLLDGYVDQQRNDLMRIAFGSALSHEAGLALYSEDDNILVLSRWLPGVSTWEQAEEALDEILNQAAEMRTALIPVEDSDAPDDGSHGRQEQRVRSLFTGAA